MVRRRVMLGLLLLALASVDNVVGRRGLDLGAAIGAAMAADAADGFENDRQRMVARIDEMLAQTSGETGGLLLSAPVRAALLAVPRHEFVPVQSREAAYANRPLGIGQGQTISQPYIVALMTELLVLRPDSRVLEIGTGSAYQAAVLSRLTAGVWTIEIVPALGREAAAVLARLGYANVHARIGDGYAGWPEAAPFDAVIVTAAPDHVPPALIEQLKPGGRLVIPVGGRDEQVLLVVSKGADGRATTETVIPVRFVPLTRD